MIVHRIQFVEYFLCVPRLGYFVTNRVQRTANRAESPFMQASPLRLARLVLGAKLGNDGVAHNTRLLRSPTLKIKYW